MALFDDADRYDVPAEVRGGRTWALSPPHGVQVQPPVALRLLDEHGFLGLHIAASWTPWSEPGTHEHEQITSNLHALLASDWQLHGTPSRFALNVAPG